MATFQSLDEAREYFKNDRFATNNGMQIDELDEGTCVCSMDVTEGHKNAHGGIMGGVMFTLADFAFAVASNHVYQPTVALQVSINFFSVPKGDRLIAKAACKKDGRTTCIYDIDVLDSTGRTVAQFIGTGYKHLK